MNQGQAFAKGHGTENDFVLLPDPDGALRLTETAVRRLCDRRAGVGADGVLRVVRTAAVAEVADLAPQAEWFMDYRNADGSYAEMCGNGIRVFVRYLLEEGLAAPGAVSVASRGGVKLVEPGPDGALTVDLGPGHASASAGADVAGQRLAGTAVSMGNPHLACLLPPPLADRLVELDLSTVHPADAAEFPDGVNVELLALAAPLPGADAHVRMRVLERGVGETRSCGTGAAAGAYAALGSNRTGRVVVDVPGGRLTVTVTERTALLTGPAVIVARGWLDPAGWPAAAQYA